jgi:amidophosphoribosyltransferase
MCGIIAIINHIENRNIIQQSLVGINKLKNRGRDSYGLLFVDKENHSVLIKQTQIIEYHDIVNNNIVSNYSIVLGHTRYSTNYLNGSKGDIGYAQPLLGIHPKLGDFYLVHNGNINFNQDIKNNYPECIDSQILVKIIENIDINNWIDIINHVLKTIPGVYNVIILNNQKLYAFKDKYSVRPLCIGSNKSGYCVSSESNALGNYNYLYEINAGEILKIDDKITKFETEINNNLNICLFEYIYFLNPNSIINDQNVFQIRYNFGRKLAESEIITNKEEVLVVGSPNTGIASAMGFADYLHIKYSQILKKNENTDRSFILKNNESRNKECSKKFMLDLSSEPKDKVIYFLDDSIVRGNTIRHIIELLKSFEPKEIHIRIPAPKILDICKFGIDIPTREELLMNFTDEKQFCQDNNIQSLKFMDIDSITGVLSKGLAVGKKDICVGCFSGKYENKLLDW